jgi:predicted AlkP superfamily phosphohydrolase/phosphomutase
MSVSAAPPPLVVLGFDVGDPEWLRRWAEEGYLPTLASIMQKGVWGRTTGPDLITEHHGWVSLISGISVSKHGFYFYRRLKPGTYELQTITGRDAHMSPFWAHISTPGKRAAIIDVPHFYPPPDIAGIHLAEWATHYPSFPPSASPTGLLKEVRRVFGRQIRIPEKLNSSLREDRRIYDRLRRRIAKKGALCRHLLAQNHFDVTVVVFGDSHVASHQFWEYRPEHRGERKTDERDELTYAIRDIYQRIDQEMGSLIDRLPANANTCIVSSTGLLDHYPTTGLIEAFCRKLGYQASPSGSDRMRPMSLLRRTVPVTWRYALSRWLPERTQQRLMNEKFQSGTDWSNTTAFAIPSFFTSFLRVNLRGREPRGIVEPGAEYEALLDRLEADLRLLTDPKTGGPVVKDIVRTGAAFGHSTPDLLPDLLVEWQSLPRYMERVVHPKGELIQYPPEIFRGSDHSRFGFVAMAGPSIRARGSMGDVSLLDLAPTFLALMGESTPREMTGEPLPIVTD